MKTCGFWGEGQRNRTKVNDQTSRGARDLQREPYTKVRVATTLSKRGRALSTLCPRVSHRDIPLRPKRLDVENQTIRVNARLTLMVSI